MFCLHTAFHVLSLTPEYKIMVCTWPPQMLFCTLDSTTLKTLHILPETNYHASFQNNSWHSLSLTQTRHIPCSKSHANFLLLTSFQGISPSLKPCCCSLTFQVLMVRSCWPFIQTPSCIITHFRLSMNVYSIYFQLPSISGGLLHPQLEDVMLLLQRLTNHSTIQCSDLSHHIRLTSLGSACMSSVTNQATCPALHTSSANNSFRGQKHQHIKTRH